MRYLVLRLQAPLMSFGEGDYWDVRGTGAFPTKSAILGILSCCLGWNQNESDKIVELGESISVSAREDIKCSIQRDYHTIMNTLKADGKSNDNAVQSYRNYLMDGAFSVLVASKSDFVFESIKKALESPVWMPFLGRKACSPSLPLFLDEEINSSNAKTAFEKLKTVPEILRQLQIEFSNVDKENIRLACITDEKLENNMKRSLIRDTVVNSKLRVFAQREVYKFYVEVKQNVPIQS
ncbi:type I-E CRISPR-associated protein Cas5/CasD [Leptospira sp. 85282-16]|uniref:type I-E CRISPR-associated protein Cas5/CasD n=1 Tax=Leptospira sp. 85282-16 TaxID=2971256 RepID=UPI0021BE1792|nr:type I-E CRISPR-associated protein Cas5/CasD [Leptospira sp. 85282-16]MCT8335188.1 type I-E CRISPR-associated protein Cas5/CasD [Leptospira sp. 85282-16]